MRTELLDRRELLDRLPAVEPEADAGGREFEHASLGRALLNLVGLDQEREYALCRECAEHLLGQVPEPDDREF
jgi:hypothetical protein